MGLKRTWIQREGKLVEVDSRPRARRPKFPSVHVDSISPYRHTVTGEMVESRTQHKRILKQHGLIELGNEFDHWKREIENPDFDDEGRLRWRDPLSEADERVYQENTEWLAKNST